MKITKYIHSCLLFEKDGFKLLFDPGKFSFAEGLVKPDQFADINAVIITHNHPDHLDTDNLRKIIELSQAAIYTNAEVSQELKEACLESIIVEEGEMTLGHFLFQVINVKHEPLLDSPAPNMHAYVIDQLVLHPVDSFDEKLNEYQGIPLLILPIMAPFTTELAVAGFADRINPKEVLPVHDGYAKPFFLKQRYENYTEHFEKNNIKFYSAGEPGDALVISQE
ncbi:MBL fold metallo-hydrolase [Mucilaginibacter sp. CAU 1740]|uniref:MBL fold metallo-hydrolase n=1 Tax=Mucilaginibacter sp. CAU 1740 TaxID=3140365 RepID=UPI00325B3793